VALNTIRVFNQELWPLAQTEDLPIYNGSTIQLRYDQNLITLSYDGLYFANTDEIKYSHFLKGFDEEWSLPSNNRQTTYTNLDPGTYTFVVKASNSDNVWSEEVVLLTFEITPPWWQTWWAYGSYVILFFAFTAYSYEYQRQRVLKVEQEKNRERELEHARQIERAYSDLEVAHENLKSAQKQLVEQEKLASLGQLTAGIAHEIKNPLNFVNNFSAVSIELVDEAVADVEKYVDKEEDRSFILETLSFVKGNLAKILDHGTRADGIVKSMLMHSRGGSGTMEPTSLNEIVKEYVNLAYHGMRAGKNIINVDVELSLDESVGNIPMIAEDFSRVILNLCNNAFDAMRDLIKKETPNYKARLKVSTRKEGSKIIVEVKDNGPGIPDDIRDKILEPFFTTKKGTEGTGLGLSITHDIVTAHNGTLEIDSDESGACFRIIIQA
jgi:signal transduction histidine kinase